MSSQVSAISPVPANLRMAQALERVSNVELATACGVNPRQVVRWRTGASDITWPHLCLAAERLQRSPEWFYVRHEESLKDAA